MNEDFKKSIENVVLCSEAIDELSKCLKHYTDAYSQIKDTMADFRQLEQKASTDLYETVPQIQEHMADFSQAQQEFSSLLSRSAPSFEHIAVLLQDAEQQLKANIELLTDHQENFRQIAGTLTQLDAELSETPQLAQISARIQSALGIIENLDGLDQISQKLDAQIAQIQQEKEEIIAPLKNAAAFGAVVQQEREVLESNLTKQFHEISSSDPDSMNSKLDYLVSVVLAMQGKLGELTVSQGKSGGLFSRRNKDDHRQPSKDENVQQQFGTLKDALTVSVCIVRKKSWNGDFCFVIDHIENGYAYGHTYRDGKVYGPASYPLTESNWSIYAGETAGQIRRTEIENKMYSDSPSLPL